MKRRKRVNLVVFGLILTIVGFAVHSYLAEFLEVFPNAGISFGLPCSFLVCMAFLALLIMMILFWKREDFGLMIIIVGGLINFIDRVIFGYVRDYWSLGFFYNNLADWIIVFGVLYSVVGLWKKK